MIEAPYPDPIFFEKEKEKKSEYGTWLRKQGRAGSTVVAYICFLKNIPKNVDAYFGNEDLINRTSKISAYRSYLKFLKSNTDILSRSDLLDLLDQFKPKTKRGKNNSNKRVAVPQNEWKEVTRKAPNKVAKMAMWLGFRFGLRRGEIIHLRVEDIKFENQLIQVQEHSKNNNQMSWFPKYNRERSIYFNDRFAQVLNRWINEVRPKDLNHPYLLWMPHGSRKGQNVLSRALNSWIRKTGITPHQLRYSYATHLYNVTKDIKLVSDQLGHENVSTTSDYLQFDKKTIKKKAQEALKRF